MRKIYNLVVFLAVCSITGFAQERTTTIKPVNPTCGTMDIHNQQMETNEEYRINYERTQLELNRIVERNQTARENYLQGNIVTIPVVFHILHTGQAIGEGANISEERLFSQLAQLNADFRAQNADVGSVPAEFAPLVADMEMEFCLAVRDPEGQETNGIIRYNNVYQQETFSMQDMATIKEETIWDRDFYLNMWIVNIAEDGLAGYAQFPGGPAGTDGVVLGASTIGSLTNLNPVNTPARYGRTATHEVGHWFNLKHVWGDEEGTCDGTDFVDDTPNQAGSYNFSPTYPQVSCGSSDMYMNYMDYVSGDAMHMFSLGQRERAEAALTGFRSTLLTSQGCVPVPNFNIATENVIQDVCIGDDVEFPVNVEYISTYEGTVDLSAAGLPVGVTATFNPSIFTATGSSVLTITGTEELSVGDYSFSITGGDGETERIVDLTLAVKDVITLGAELAEPINGETGVSTTPTFSWSEVANATEYILEIATDAAFTTIVKSAITTETSLTTTVDAEAEYFWRVTAINACSNVPSEVQSFITTIEQGCGNLFEDSGFEASVSPNANWNEYPSGQGLIVAGNSATGSNTAKLGGSVSLLWQDVTVPADAALVKLRFFYDIESSVACGQDNAWPAIVTTNESGGFSVSYGGLGVYELCADNQTAGYVEQCLDLSEYKGQTIGIGFYVTAPGGSFFYLDDVELAVCSTADWQISTGTEEYVADYEVETADGWTHYIDNNGTACNYLDDLLLLSVNKNGQNIGSVGDFGFEVYVNANPTSSQVSAPYNQNSTNWYTFNRYWELVPTVQPNGNVDVRYYFTNNDIESLSSALDIQIDDIPSQLSAWKINDNPTQWNLDPVGGHADVPQAASYTADGYWSYSGGVASTSSYGYAQYPSLSVGPYHYMEYVVGHFGGGGGASDSVTALPIELGDFVATESGFDAILDWTTLSEENSSHFEVEFSVNGVDFEYLSTVNSQAVNGSSDTELSYNLVDKFAINRGEVVYYRLKQVDFDDIFAYSEIRAVNFGEPIGETVIYPNPALRNTPIIVHSSNKISKLSVFNMTGDLVKTVEYAQPILVTSIDAAELSAGTYIILINNKETQKVVVQ